MVKTFSLLSLFFTVSCIAPATRFAGYTPTEKHDEVESRLLEAAASWKGCDYRYGGTDKEGVDCSGLTLRIYQEVYGMELPRTTTGQYAAGVLVRDPWLRAGDLVFFRNIRGRGVDHVGIYLGNDEFLHASSSQGVIVSKLNDPYYRRHYSGARRLNGISR